MGTAQDVFSDTALHMKRLYAVACWLEHSLIEVLGKFAAGEPADGSVTQQNVVRGAAQTTVYFDSGHDLGAGESPPSVDLEDRNG